MASKTNYECGKNEGYAGGVARYPNNLNYMAGFRRGVAMLLKECADEEPDEFIPRGAPDDFSNDHLGI